MSKASCKIADFIEQKTKEIALKKASKPKAPATPPTAQVYQLPVWAEAVRCLPNEIVRSALFNARNRRQPRAQMKHSAIAMIGEGGITFTGEELRQDDETVWLQLLHMAKSQPLGEVVEFTPYSFCKAIGWTVDGKSYIRLRACLTRMQASALAVYSDRIKEGVSLSMIPKFTWQDGKGQSLIHYQVQAAPELVKLFADVQYTRLEWEQRLTLPTGIATWLHGYFASHKKPHPIKFDTIKAGAGMTTENASSLRQSIEKALTQLVIVGFLVSYEILGDLVKVKRA